MEKTGFLGKSPLSAPLLIPSLSQEKKRIERSVKHRIHETGEKSDGESTILARISREKHYLKKSRLPAQKQENAKL